ncbi:acyl-CoA desaturase [Jiangella sp. DSM 45060]|uniref:fatty acid desaturase family protein n=1 Tax=Jiangella sp. DSM 45060 TaxID=1798224 RepID=UPI00087A8E51|nr:acyl-CoA desaturase [Jiangella sp. DSM 45060]SDS18585.1 Fatty acid desaturase [Jiangella sp. DSM 45060]
MTTEQPLRQRRAHPQTRGGAGPPVATKDRVPAPVRHVSTYTELARQIREAGLLRRRYGYYWTRIAVAVTAFAGIWVGFAFLGDSWFQLLLAAALAVVLVQFGYLGHDSAHRQIFASHRWNDWTSRVFSGLFTGLSYGWWQSKHSRHHANPNKEGSDPDVGPGVLAFTPAVAQARRGLAARLTPRQGYFFFPLLLLEGLALHVASIQTIMRRQPLKHRWWEASFVAVRLGGYLTVLLLVLPPGKAAAFFGVQMALFGLLLGASFAPNHIGMPIVAPDEKVDFLRRQVLTSRNIRGGRPIDFFMGGLNYQVEHHLFPSMPRPNLRRAQPIVREYCARHLVGYTETSLFGAYRVIVGYLNRVGLRGRYAYRCPMAAQFRV